MIDYDVLCQTIEDWKAGRRPSAPIPGPTPAAPSAAYDVDSGLVTMEDDGEGGYVEAGEPVAYAEGAEYGDGSGQYEPPAEYADGSGQYEQPAEYADGSGQYAQPTDGGEFVEQSYGDPISVQEGYTGDVDGAPEYVQRTGTPRVEQPDEPPPYAASEPAPYTEMIPTDDPEATEAEEMSVEGAEDFDRAEHVEVDADVEVDEVDEDIEHIGDDADVDVVVDDDDDDDDPPPL